MQVLKQDRSHNKSQIEVIKEGENFQKPQLSSNYEKIALLKNIKDLPKQNGGLSKCRIHLMLQWGPYYCTP